MAKVKAKLELDSKGFNTGLSRAKKSMGSLKAPAMAAVTAGFVAATAAAVGLAAGVKNVLDVGGQLSDLSARTGVAAGELQTLQVAFKQNGIESSKVGSSIAKMQKAMVESGQGITTYQRAFDSIGVSMEELKGLSSTEQFEKIGGAINNLGSSAEKNAAAMQIFGRSGSELITLFANEGAVGDAAKTLGEQAALMTKNANMFDRASDILATIGLKMQGFFVGVADTLVPALMPLLEAANGIDLSSFGQDLGEKLAYALTLITSGLLGEMVHTQFSLAATNFVNLIVSGLVGIFSLVKTAMIALPQLFIDVLSIVSKPDFWKGVGYGLLAAAQKFAAIVNRAVGNILQAASNMPGLGGLSTLAKGAFNTADRLDAQAFGNSGKSSDLLDSDIQALGDIVGEVVANAYATAADDMDSFGDATDTSGLKKNAALINEVVKNTMKANREAAAAKFQPADGSKGGAFDPDNIGGKMGGGGSASGVIAQSLQKVGGGGAFARFSDTANPAAQAVKEQKTTNKLLAKNNELLASSLGRISGGGSAVLAY